MRRHGRYNRRCLLTTFSVAPALIFALSARAQDTPTSPPANPSEKTYLLEAKYAVGDLLKYRISVKTHAVDV